MQCSLTPAAPAANLVPNVLLCIPLDYTGEAERGVLSTGQPRISTHSAQACALERLTMGATPLSPETEGRQQYNEESVSVY